MPLIIAEGLGKDYPGADGPVTALRRVDLAVEEGEFVALMGPSGSGKSTLLSIVGGLSPPTRGRLEIDQIPVYQLSVEKRADFRWEYVGFVFQQFQLLPYLTALENVLLPLAISRLPAREQKRRAEMALVRVGLAGKEGRLPGQLSGGEQERVAIARALVNAPPILLADEPTGALDGQTGREIMALFQSLNAEGLTILMVTHNPENAACARRVLRIRDGALEPTVGSPADMLKR